MCIQSIELPNQEIIAVDADVTATLRRSGCRDVACSRFCGPISRYSMVQVGDLGNRFCQRVKGLWMAVPRISLAPFESEALLLASKAGRPERGCLRTRGQKICILIANRRIAEPGVSECCESRLCVSSGCEASGAMRAEAPAAAWHAGFQLLTHFIDLPSGPNAKEEADGLQNMFFPITVARSRNCDD